MRSTRTLCFLCHQLNELGLIQTFTARFRALLFACRLFGCTPERRRDVSTFQDVGGQGGTGDGTEGNHGDSLLIHATNMVYHTIQSAQFHCLAGAQVCCEPFSRAILNHYVP